MAFTTSISGLNAAQASLGVIGHNVSNASTTGFKASRTQFADIFPSSNLGTAATSIGAGVRLSAVSQQHTQGNISFTNNALDLAVNGQGFFRLSKSGTITYSRDGSFGVDKDGYIANSAGLRLTGYTASDGTVTGNLGEIRLSQADAAPKTTSKGSMVGNLDSSQTAKTAADPALAMGAEVKDAAGNSYVPPRYAPPDPKSYNHATSFTVYDSLGSPHTTTLYFRKTAANAWTMEMSIDNQAFVAPTEGTSLTFDTSGKLTGPAGPPLGQLSYTAVAVSGGAANMAFTMDMSGLTQYGSAFSVSELKQDGYATGRLAGLDIDSTGVVYARYTNGQSKAMGQVALANFTNPQGLTPQGDTAWSETAASGQALVGTPGSGALGVVQSGALEESNVNLTEQLVDMITAQRNFQANAQMISTEDAITQTIINIR